MHRSRLDRADDLDRLREFALQAAYLDQSSAIQGRVGASLNISWQQGGPVRWTSKLPRGEMLDSLLLRLRPFLTPGGIGIDAIHNICNRRLDHAEMLAFLRTIREDWRRSQRHGAMGLRIDDRDMPPRYVADLFITAHFHPENTTNMLEYRAIVGGARILTEHVFIDYVYRATEAIYSTADVVRIGLEGDMFR